MRTPALHLERKVRTELSAEVVAFMWFNRFRTPHIAVAEHRIVRGVCLS